MNLRNALKWLLTLVLLALVLRFVEWPALLAALRAAAPGYYLLSTLVFLASFVLVALRLRALLQATELADLGWQSLLNIHVSSMFYGFLLPSDLGTAAIRWYRVTQNRRGRSVFVLVTLLERLLTAFVTLLVATAALAFAVDPAIAAFRRAALPLLGLLLVALGLALLVFFVRGLHAFFGRWLRDLQARLARRWIDRVFALYWDIGHYHARPAALWHACALQAMFQALLLLRFILLFACLQLALPVLDVVWVSMLVLFLTLLPLTIAGLGVREGGFAAALALFALPAEPGVLLGLLAFSQIVVVLLWGGVVALIQRGRPGGA